MKRKGFTMIELIGVIIVLGVIATFITPVVGRLITSSENVTYEQQLINIRMAARNWAAEHIFDTPAVGDETIILSLTNDLIANGYVNKDIKNPKTGEVFRNVEVYVTNYNGALIYDIYENGSLIGADPNRGEDLPIITLVGNQLIYLNIGDTYNELGAEAVTGGGSPLSVTVNIMKDGVTVAGVDTSAIGTYLVVYSAINNGISNSVVRTVIIK